MFESTSIKHEITKAEFKAEEPRLREQLIEAQLELLESEKAPVIVLLSGIDPLGRSAAANRLMSWMDARHIRPYAQLQPSEEELQRPRMWPFWRALPRRGRIGIFLNSWYETPISEYLLGRIDHERYRDHIDEIIRFEQMLADEGALILKFMFMLPEKQTRKVLKDLSRQRLSGWKVSEPEIEIRKHFAKHYDEGVAMLEELVSITSKAPEAPWIPIASANARYRDLTIGKTLVDAIDTRLTAPEPAAPAVSIATVSDTSSSILKTLDHAQSIDKSDYRRQLKKEQGRLSRATLDERFEARSIVAVFEGNDAAGKGGCIRRVVQVLDPRMLRVISIAAPSDEERAQPYLWRFWRHIPQTGHVTIFDRSWYGRVLVERVEGFCPPQEWMRAYEEVRNFEAELSAYGIIVMKFWLAIDKDEQLRRFEAREDVGYKRHKITEEDWRNREKWNDYEQAVNDMIDRTSTSSAPWTLVAANDKYSARVKVLKTINDRLEAEL